MVGCTRGSRPFGIAMARCAACLALACLLAVSSSLPKVVAQSSPNAAVFQVLVWRITGRHLESLTGTGFFITADGTALTASHVVYDVKTNRTFHVSAIVGDQIYDAALVCASPLDADYLTGDKAEMVRDVAEIRIVPSGADSVGDLTYNGKPYVHQHHGPIPRFPFLQLAPPQEGDEARTFGFGHRSSSPIPYPWSATGTVEHLIALDDGTPGFDVRYSTPTEPGHSGSPVLNALGEVIGVHNWHSRKDPHLGTAVSSEALDPACR
jgi:trypsin-like peptidase